MTEAQVWFVIVAASVIAFIGIAAIADAIKGPSRWWPGDE